jgi:tRNA threonylcarbamoyladenosine biosynthesis protein TsaE
VKAVPPLGRAVTQSTAGTVAFGRALASSLRAGDIVLLCGEMGAGKTYLAKGIVAGLGAGEEDDVASPAYDIVHQFAGRETVYHYDLFRMQQLSGDDIEWLTESLSAPGVHVVEWGDRLEGVLRRSHLKITVTPGENEDERVIVTEAGS